MALAKWDLAHAIAAGKASFVILICWRVRIPKQCFEHRARAHVVSLQHLHLGAPPEVPREEEP